MNKKKFRVIASLMTMTLLMTLIPLSSKAANNPGKTTITGTEAISSEDSAGIRFSWKKVEKATGYQYRYNLFWTKDSKASEYTKSYTKNQFAKIYFQDCETVRFQVRPYVMENGKKTFGKWATCTLTSNQIKKLPSATAKKMPDKLYRLVKGKTYTQASSGGYDVKFTKTKVKYYQRGSEELVYSGKIKKVIKIKKGTYKNRYRIVFKNANGIGSFISSNKNATAFDYFDGEKGYDNYSASNSITLSE